MKKFFLLLVAGLIACPAFGDDASTDVVRMDKFVLSQKPDDPFNILPDRQVSSVFGTDSTLAEIPRSITVVESELLDRYSIRTVNDFVAVAAGTFTGNYFGVPGALDVRGERADNFFRGFRRVENRGNFPTPITTTDHVEIIKGPPPPIYGGGKVGGALNFVPKTAESATAKLITEPEGKLTATFGTYSKRLGTLEYGAPFSLFGKKAGYYAFGSDEDSKSYYNNIYNKDLIGQVAVNVELGDGFTSEFGTMIQHANLNQSLGWNRVTQDLIDHGTYLAGSPQVNLVQPGQNWITPSRQLAPFQLLTFAFTNNFAPIFLNSPGYAAQAALFALDPATVHTVHLSHHQVQAENLDFSKTDAATAYFDLVKDFAGTNSLKNQTFVDNMNHTKYSSYGFTADYQDFVFENKTTGHVVIEPNPNFKWDNIGGFSFRYTDGDEREARDSFQVMNRRDISVGATPNTRFEGAYTGTGDVPYNWRQIGASGDLGGFALTELTVFERATLTLAGRDDRVQAHTTGTDLNGVFSHASGNDTAFTYNASVNVKLTPTLIPYVTYAKSRYIELGQGGMIDVLNLGGGTWIQPSQLTEAGIKYTGFRGKLYTTLAVYKQDKSSFNNQSGQFDFYRAHGVESELRFAPDKHWSFTGAATWQRPEILNAPFFLSIPPAVLGFTNPAQAYGGNFNGVGALLGIYGPRRVPGPDKIFSAMGTYLTDFGLGMSFGGTYVAAYYAGYFQQIHLPKYTVCKASVFYNYGRHWTVSVEANNIFNASYFTPQFLFQEVFISPSQGTTADATFAYKW